MNNTAVTPGRDGEALRLEDHLCFALYSASLAMNRLYRGLLADLGLTYPQYLVLLVLWDRDGLRVSEIGEQLFLDSATLTPLLKRLEKSGLLKRTRDAEDERGVRVTLTKAGVALRRRARDVPAAVACAAAAPEGQGDLGVLVRKLRRLRDRLLDQ